MPMVAIESCPTAPIVGVTLDLSFYRQIACNTFDSPALPEPTKHWTRAPSLYIFTQDEAGAPIDAVTLDTVQRAMVEEAPILTNGRFQLAAVERGTDLRREGVSGWIAVKWATTTEPSAACGRAQVAIDGGWIELNPYVGGGCSCNGSLVRPRTARHELGHALGYWHTDSASDLMSGLKVSGCDQGLSARELQAIAYHYR